MTAPAAPSVLPWMPGAVRQYLLGDAAFAMACGDDCSSRAPSNADRPFARVRMAGPAVVQGGGLVFRPMLLVEGWAAPSGDTDPEVAAWRIAAAAVPVLARAANVRYRNCWWKCGAMDAIATDVDQSRGTDAPLYRAFLRAEIIVKVDPSPSAG